MKKVFFLIGLLWVTSGLKAQEKVTIDGKIEGLNSKKMYLIIPDPDGVKFDSIMVNNGSFHYEGITQPNTYARIATGEERVIKRIGNRFLPNSSSNIGLFLSPGAKIKITGKVTDFADAYPSGDEANNTLANLNRIIYPLDNERANLMVKLETEKPADASAIQARMTELSSQIEKIKQQAIFNNPNSVATIWLLSDMMLRREISNEDASRVFPKISVEKFSSVPYYQEIKGRIEGAKATTIGQQVPEIAVEKDYKGNPFELSALRGKFVLLDFWGTWCHPCVDGMPKMKEYQDKYKDRLALVGIAKDSEEAWRAWLNNNPEYNWIQLLDPKEESLIPKFNVTGYPTKIIISPEGKILARFMGEGEELYDKIDELLAK